MTNKKLLEKLKEDMEMRGFSHHTKDRYDRKAKEITEYFGNLMKKWKIYVTLKFIRHCLENLKGDEKYGQIKKINSYNYNVNCNN